MKKAVLAGESVTNAVSMAVEHISKEVKDWDKEKFKKEYEEKLNKVTNESGRERDNEKVLLKRIEELKRRIKENDFSAEEYKAKKTLSEKEQVAKDEYDKVKKLYDETKKESPEYIDKKAKFGFMYGLFSNPKTGKIKLFKAMKLCIQEIEKQYFD